MKLAVITANCGAFDPLVPSVAQDLPPGFSAVDHYLFDDRTFPRRETMAPRLQARIPKMFGWELAPGYDAYIWHDASYSMQRTDAAAWFVEHLTMADACFFLHPHRKTVVEEADYIAARIRSGDRYLCCRYLNEDIEGQLKAIEPAFFGDDYLIASSAFAYFPTAEMKAALSDWWLHTSRYHAVDQLALPFVLWKHRIEWNAIEANIYDFPYLTRTRERGRV